MKFPRWIAAPLFALPWFVAGCVATWLILLRFPPSGVIEWSVPFDGRQMWFTSFLPAERVSSPGRQSEGWTGQRIFANPVYAGAHTPGAFDRIRLTFEMRPSSEPLLEFGFLRDPASFDFDIQPLWSSELEHGWTRVTGTFVGYVRNGTFASPFADPAHTLVWHGNASSGTNFMDSRGELQRVSTSLRGSQDIFFIPVAGRAYFRFSVQDVNRKPGRHSVAFLVSKGDRVLSTEALGLSGATEIKPEHVLEKTLTLDHLAPGIYKIAIRTDENVFVRTIETNALHWVLGPRVWFGDAAGYGTSTPPVYVWTNSRHASVETFHPEARQTVAFGFVRADINQTHADFYVNRPATDPNTIAPFNAPKGDIRFIGDGYVAFDPRRLFFPQPRRMTDATQLDAENINAVVTPYEGSEDIGDGWKRVSVDFDLPRDFDTLKFVLSAPGMEARRGHVDIREARLRYERPALTWSDWWAFVEREAAAAWKRLWMI